VDSNEWRTAAKLLTDAGSEAYKAAQSKDAKALAAVTAHIDASCTNCHKQFRPNVFPPSAFIGVNRRLNMFLTGGSK